MRYFLCKDASAIVREKQVFAGDDSKTNAYISTFCSEHLGWTVLETDQATFDATPSVVDPSVDRGIAVDIFLNSPQPISKVDRAAALVIMDELNILRGWIMAFKAQVALAASLADLKTRIATLSDLQDRQSSQIKGAIQNKINGGTAD